MEIQILRIKCGLVNCYALRDADTRRCILVDAGKPNKKDAVLRGMARYGIAPGAPELLLLTHNHADHTGTVDYLRARGVPVALHPADVPLPGALHHQGLLGQALAASSRSAVAGQQPLRADIALQHGMSLAPYGVAATVLHLPGHTAGSVGVLLDDGRLVCGDLFFCLPTPCPAPIAEDFEQLAQSIASLRAHGVTTVYPGHGKPFPLDKR